MKNILFVLTFFSLWLSTKLNMQAQDFLAYALILTFGVLHGSNDINLLARFSLKRYKGRVILFRYLSAIAAVAAVFLVSKTLALFFFLLISGYHFGEQHLRENYHGPSWLATALFSVYGLLILFLIFFLKVEEVIPIFIEITGITFEASFFMWGFYGFSWVLIPLFLFSYWKKYLKIFIVKELFLFFVFYIVFNTASLIWAFGIYFIVWHSLPSLYDQMIFLYGNASKQSMLKYLKSSLPYWLLSILGLGLLYLFLGKSTDYFITIVLYLLASITFPHVLVMSQIEHAKN